MYLRHGPGPRHPTHLRSPQEPDVLLLDEPTNHLDWAAIEWLAAELGSGGGSSGGGGSGGRTALVLVTHDRYFLERTCSEIAELDQAGVAKPPPPPPPSF